jgi:DNA-binding MarR family transcriptional regulator
LSRPDKLRPPGTDSDSQNPPADDIRLQINLRLRLDEIAEAEAEILQVSARRRPTRRELCQLACTMYDARRTRDRILDQELFGEPAWDMLLALYGLPSRGELLSVTALNYAANVPQTTGYRWQATLTEAGLIERGPPEVDARRQILRLTAKGRQLLEQYLIRLFYSSVPAPPD